MASYESHDRNSSIVVDISDRDIYANLTTPELTISGRNKYYLLLGTFKTTTKMLNKWDLKNLKNCYKNYHGTPLEDS